MNIFTAFSAGVGKVNSAKRYIAVYYCINLLIAAVFGFALANYLQQSLGNSLAGHDMLQGFDGLWYNSFSQSAAGIAGTFSPSVTGIGALLNALDSFLQGNLLAGNAAIAGFGILYLIVSAFFAGGFIKVYAGQEGGASFYQHAGRFFLRFLVLAVISGAVYLILFSYLFSWMTSWVNELNRGTIDERVHFAYVAGKYVIMWLVMWLINMIFDYGKIFVVVKDIRNVLAALARAVGFVFGNCLKTAGLYLLVGCVWIIIFVVYWIVVPEAGGASWFLILLGFVISQLFLLSRMWTRLLFFGSQTVLCSSLLPPEKS